MLKRTWSIHRRHHNTLLGCFYRLTTCRSPISPLCHTTLRLIDLALDIWEFCFLKSPLLFGEGALQIHIFIILLPWLMTCCLSPLDAKLLSIFKLLFLNLLHIDQKLGNINVSYKHSSLALLTWIAKQSKHKQSNFVSHVRQLVNLRLYSCTLLSSW